MSLFQLRNMDIYRPRLSDICEEARTRAGNRRVDIHIFLHCFQSLRHATKRGFTLFCPCSTWLFMAGATVSPVHTHDSTVSTWYITPSWYFLYMTKRTSSTSFDSYVDVRLWGCFFVHCSVCHFRFERWTSSI